MKGKVNHMLGYLIGGILGAGLGFLYYKFVGCPTGACPITSNPYASTIYGAVIGLLLGGAVGG
ncbi:MAG: DUF6132 family protein [Clostridiaceae bacterium]|nr:DUF6132 family protein [Clostridiaceae bacterium]